MSKSQLYLSMRLSVCLIPLLLSGCSTFNSTQVDPTEPERSPARVAETLDRPLPPSTEALIDTPVSVDVVQAPEEAPPVTDLWVRIRDGFSLSHETDRARVLNELNWYVKHPDYVDRVARRAAPHLHYIVSEIEKRGLPTEFALLPIVESAYDPFAYSHGRAAGLWQFIPGTARVYGLKIDWWYDGRRDVRASTEAAISYLEHLHELFDGDWLLALAAYNAGEGNVMQSVRASRRGKPRDQHIDFWHLNVFRETYTYVPRLLAISELIANPGKYNITLPDISNEPTWEVVDIGSQLDLSKAAQLADLSQEALYKLNPGFNQWATHPDGPHELVIPIEKAESFREQLALLPAGNRVAWTRHKIRRGENLGSIARKYRTTIDTIRTANNLRGNLIREGQSLLIPAASTQVAYAMTAEGRLAAKQASLEQRYGSEPLMYTVQPGDSFWEISRKYNVGMRELARWNGMGTTGLLHPGTQLKIFKQPVTAAQALPVAAPSIASQVRKINYRVRNGESLSRIASKFNVTVKALKEWNKSLGVKKYIHPGDRLTIYVDVTAQIN